MAAFDSALPCPLPPRADADADALNEYRDKLGDERMFARARRKLREAGDWASMAKLLVEHAAAIAGEPDKHNKVAELAVQAYELFTERVSDRPSGVHALARALLAQPENDRAYERLYLAYQELGWSQELATLLRWRMSWARKAQPSLLAGLHYGYAELQRERFHAISEAVEHYEQALAQDPMLSEAADQLIELHLRAGAWQRAGRLMEAELSQLEAHPSYAADPGVAARISELHVRLARIAFEQHRDLPSAARHLQAAIKTTPQNLRALREFGTLYLGSGKASDEGRAKASSIFLKAAQLARVAGDEGAALKLLRRTLSLRPDHLEAAQMFSEVLAEQGHWMELDDHYRHMLTYVQGHHRVQTLLRRAQNLDQRLQRREEARLCYEEAGQSQHADGEAWMALERIYRDTADWTALGTLLEWKSEQLGANLATASLLEAANIFHHRLDDHERAAVFYFKVLEREPFNPEAFEGYKEHFRRKHAWSALRDLILYQIDQGFELTQAGQPSPLDAPEFASEFVELAEVCERRLGDVDGAVHAWKRMSQAYPRDGRPREQIARIQKRTRMWDNMVRVQEAELARAQDPRKRLEIIKRLAQIYRDRQVNPQRAIELYSEMQYLAPEDMSATRALTALYDRAGDHQQVMNLLRTQYEVARSGTERVSLLRRMAELWHHELGAIPEATWACEEILAVTGNDLEALHRLQLLARESNDAELLLAALERELKVTGKVDGKSTILRRIARVIEAQLGAPDRAASYWQRLLDLEPDRLEVVDKMIAVYDNSGRFEELAELLGKAASSSKTPIIRQLDYLLRLGYLAESHLGDPDLARTTYERVIKIRPDHRRALDALANLYRIDDDYEGLAEILGKLREIADSDEEAFLFGWEQAQLLLHQVDDPGEAAEVLAWIAREIRPGDPEVNAALLDAYKRAANHHALIGHAELMLLGTADGSQRAYLYRLAIEAWQELDDKRAAVQVSSRLLAEFPDDPQGHAQLAELQEDLGEYEAALRSLARKLESIAHDPDQQIETLRRMAEIADVGIGDRNRALELLRRASGIDATDPELREHIQQFAEVHGTWKELLEIDELRINRLAEMGDVAGQLDVCTEASRIAEEMLEDADRAFSWARRGYFIARAQQLDFDQGFRRLHKLAKAHGLWTALLEVAERELERETFADPFELIERMIEAAEIAENELDDPARAVAYLQRALQESPGDEELGRRIESIAEAHSLWNALLRLGEHRLHHADSVLDRFDAFCEVARIHERKLDDPRAAFATLRRAWIDLRERDTTLAEEGLDLAINLAEGHQLWRDLADHHAALAHEHAKAGRRLEAVDALAEAAAIVDERLDDSIAAMRVLLRGVTLDPERDVIFPRLRELAARVDEAAEDGAHSGVKVGALVELRALGMLAAKAKTDAQIIRVLGERAEIREQRLDDGNGALAEWLRVLELDPKHDGARDEAERLAGRYDLWHRYLLLPGWELEHAHDNPTQVRLLDEIADLYEHKLGRPEYAMRARLEAWRRDSSLPPRSDELPPPHNDLWRLASVVGSYAGPALPKDPLLSPALAKPELQDMRLWQRARLDPQHLTPPGGSDAHHSVTAEYDDPHAEGDPDELTAVAPMDAREDSVVELSRVEEIPTEESVVEEVSRVELVEDSEVMEISRVEAIEDISEASVVEFIDDIEELEIDELDTNVVDDPLDEIDTKVADDPYDELPTRADIQEMSSADLESASVSGEIGKSTQRPTRRKSSIPGKLERSLDPSTERFGSKTIPLPKPGGLDAEFEARRDQDFDLAAGLPEVPSLAGPLLPPRPRVASAWEELAAAYAERPTANKAQKVEVQLACARLWEEGAEQLERAFACHERALLLVPEQPDTVANLEQLAARHDARPRLLRSWTKLLSEAALPEHVVALNLRIAAFHERDEDLDDAIAHYRAVLAVNPAHVLALTKLLSVYERLERQHEYVETYADLLRAEREGLADEELIERSLELARLYTEQGRLEDALELLGLLLRDHPREPRLHERIVELQIERREWLLAVDALRTANESLPDDTTLVANNLARIAEIYRHQLELPDRAIDAWNDYRELEPADDRPLVELQELYEQTARWSKLLPILDARLDATSVDPELDDDARQARRIKLLVVKARALQEGLGDELAATETLEQLAEDAPDDDDVALGLSRLYRRTDRFERGVSLLDERIAGLREAHAAASGDERAALAARITALSLELATVLHAEAKRHADALALVRAGLELDGDHRELIGLQTKLARALHDLPLLLDSLERLGRPEQLLEAGDLARARLDQPERAEANYRKVLDAAHTAQATDAERGPDGQGAGGEADASARSITDAPREADDERDAWPVRMSRAIEGIVRLRIAAEQLDAANAFMDEQLSALRDDMLRARLLTDIGRITYRTTGEVEAARARFDAALALAPDHAEARLGLGELLLDAGALAEAETQLEGAVEALTLVRDQTHLVEGLVLLARVLEADDRANEAYRRLTTAQRHDPDNLAIRLAIVSNRLNARRNRDVINAVDQLHKRLDARTEDSPPLPAKDRQRLAEIHAIAAEAELAVKHPEQAEARLDAALDYDPNNVRALAFAVPIVRERGDLIAAAGYASRLAESIEDPHARGSAYVDAGMLYREAAQLAANGIGLRGEGGRKLTANERRSRIAELEREAFESVRLGIVLVADSPTPVLDTSQLEVAFRASASHDPALALRCLERLLLAELDDEARVELLLDGVGVALLAARDADDSAETRTDEDEPASRIELAARYADEALELDPLSASAVLAKARVLEVRGQTDALEPLVSAYLERVEQQRDDAEASEPDDDLAARASLLIRLAEIQTDKAPAQAASSLEDAARLTRRMSNPARSAFGLAERKHLAELYRRLDEAGKVTSESKILANHRGLLEHDPCYLPSLRALAERHAAANEHGRARPMQAMIALLEPDDDSATAYLAAHAEALAGEANELELDPATGPILDDAGMSTALAQLWDAGQNLLGDQLGALSFDAKARVSPVKPDALGQAWREVLRRLGQTKVALVTDPALDERDDADDHPASAWIEPRCQTPPILVASARAREARDGDQAKLEFAIARGLYRTRGSTVLAGALSGPRFAAICSALLLALHPRHVQRKQAARTASDPISKLGHELSRKLPIRVARQLGGLLEQRADERFDSRLLKTWIGRASDRVGLIVCGDVAAALEVLGVDARGPALAEAVAADADARALLAYFVSGAYAERRRQLGYVVEGDETQAEIDTPPIPLDLAAAYTLDYDAMQPAPELEDEDEDDDDHDHDHAPDDDDAERDPPPEKPTPPPKKPSPPPKKPTPPPKKPSPPPKKPTPPPKKPTPPPKPSPPTPPPKPSSTNGGPRELDEVDAIEEVEEISELDEVEEISELEPLDEAVADDDAFADLDDIELGAEELDAVDLDDVELD